jgi:CO/xanthine dehydrogenase FAD-binding subunit
VKLPPLSYFQPATVAEALEIWSGRDVMFIAGGQGLVSEMAQGLRKPSAIVDVSGIPELRAIEPMPGASVIRIGAAVTLAELGRHPALAGTLLATAARHVGVPPIRTLATVGGNFCHGHPTSELPLAALVAQAAVTAVGRDGSPVRVTGAGLAALRPTSDRSELLITGLEWPVSGNGQATGFIELGEQRSWLPAVALGWLADQPPNLACPAPHARIGIALRNRARFVVSRPEGSRVCTAASVAEAAATAGILAEVPAAWLADLITDQIGHPNGSGSI